MVVGKLPVPGGPANLDSSRARPLRLQQVCVGGGVVWTIFLSSIISLIFPLSGRRPYID